MSDKLSAEATLRRIRRKTRWKFSTEEKIRIVVEGLRDRQNIAELCLREGINQNLYYLWKKELFEVWKTEVESDKSRIAKYEDFLELLQMNEKLKDLLTDEG